ncbi:MAG: indole-3-glycerol phosphate synthase TrpC [Acidimicrobiales bacterium]
MTTYLDRIAAWHRTNSAADDRPLSELAHRAGEVAMAPSFRQALLGDRLCVIAEVKRRSPSKGDLAPILNPELLVKSYVAGGAAAVSVLTDEEFFNGSVNDLRSIRTAHPDLAILRKDFTVSVRDVYDAKIMGASAILLIVAILSDDELRTFSELAHELDMTSLFEVHDSAEIDRAQRCGAQVIGVNQRNLATFAVDTERALELVEKLPNEVVRVAESGITTIEQCVLLADAGFDAVLVGEVLVRSEDPAREIGMMAGLRSRSSGDGVLNVH